MTTNIHVLYIFQADFADNREFIALLVYDTGGKKIYYPRKL